MKFMAQSIAFCGLVAGATVLEIHDKPASGLWVLLVLVVLWVLFGDWCE